MKILLTTVALVATSTFFAQSGLGLREEIQNFSIGSKNALVLTIPHAKMDVLESELKSELKDWGGKYKSSKGEWTMMQGAPKFMDKKAFDAYVITTPGTDGSIKVSFAIDLGGAFLNGKEHPTQFTAMSKRLLEFGKKVASESVKEEVKMQEKALEVLEKDQKSLEKDKKELEESIEDYKKKIAEAETKIRENESLQSEKKTAISNQAEKIKEVEKLQKSF